MKAEEMIPVHSDEELVHAVQAGGRVALTELYHRHVHVLHGYLRRRVDTVEAAEDCTSETFIAVVERLHSFRGDSSFRTWLFQIARRKLADYWRRAYKMPLADFTTIEMLAGADEGQDDEGHARQTNLHAVLAALPDRYRRVLQCRFLDGKTIQETSHILGCTESNVKVLQHRAIRYAARNIAQP